jgi:outer membrane protein, heavy metal efflux system
VKSTICVLFILTTAAPAQPPVLSPEEAVATALRSHPLLAAATARTAAADGYRLQSSLRPNPRFTFQTENWRAYGSPTLDPSRDVDIFAYMQKPIETGGKRERRMEVAGAGRERSGLEREVLERQIALRVQQAYWMAVGAEKVVQLLEETARTFQQVVEYHEIRVREGAMAEADLLKVRLEGERLNVSVHAAALEVERARIQLFREMGQEASPIKLADLPDDTSATGEADPAAAENRPEIRLARKAVEQAKANVRLQRANARPDVDLVLGYKRTAGQHTVVGGVQVNLPVSNRNEGLIAAADAEVRAASSDVAAAEALVRAEVRAASAEVRMRREQLTHLYGEVAGGGLRGMATESLRIALAAYREGGTDLLRLLDAERVRIELQVQYYPTLAEYRQSVAALESALGVNR